MRIQFAPLVAADAVAALRDRGLILNRLGEAIAAAGGGVLGGGGAGTGGADAGGIAAGDGIAAVGRGHAAVGRGRVEVGTARVRGAAGGGAALVGPGLIGAVGQHVDGVHALALAAEGAGDQVGRRGRGQGARVGGCAGDAQGAEILLGIWREPACAQDHGWCFPGGCYSAWRDGAFA